MAGWRDGGGPGASLPGGAYATYKRATAYFLDWLLRVRATGAVDVAVETVSTTGDSSGRRNRLDVYDRIVEAIARAPGKLPASVMKRWPLAIEACESAIALRERVARFYAPSQSYTQHEHFVSRMRAWLATLQGAAQSDTPITTQATTRPLDCTNYFDVLELPDDYFPVETPTPPESGAPPGPPSGSMSLWDAWNLMWGDSVDEDSYELDWELAYFFMELDELSEAVYSAFWDVKREKKTLVEAGVVAKVAIDIASTVIARLQLRQPSISSLSDLEELMIQRMDAGVRNTYYRAAVDAWTPPVVRRSNLYTSTSPVQLLSTCS